MILEAFRRDAESGSAAGSPRRSGLKVQVLDAPTLHLHNPQAPRAHVHRIVDYT